MSAIPLPSSMKNKKVGLYGLSGDPPTGKGGHLGIVNFLSNHNIFDEIWIIPVFKHMFSSKSNMTLFEHRYKMCELCFLNNNDKESKVKVLNIEELICKERNMKAVGTYDLLKYLNEYYINMNINWTFVLGSDTYNSLMSGKWKKGNDILELLSSIIVCVRPGYDTLVSCTNKKINVSFQNVPALKNISSTCVRSIASTTSSSMLSLLLSLLGKKSIDSIDSDAVHPAVIQYIKDNKLYDSYSSVVPSLLCSASICLTILMSKLYQ